MHQVYKTAGFIFKKEERLDADQVFSVFAQDFGRIEIFGKSIRAITSKLKSGMEVFFISEIEFIQGKKHKTLTSAMVVKKFKNIVLVPEKMEIATRVCCMLDDFIGGQQPDQIIWNLVADFFQKLNDYSLPTTCYSLVYHYFFWNFISVLGYKPELFKCSHCAKTLNPAQLYFSNKEGGIICLHCLGADKNAIKTNADIIKVLRLFLHSDFDIMLKLKIEKTSFILLQKISENYYSYLNHNK